jgi:hypothetical protein
MRAFTPNEATITGAVLGAILGALFGGMVSFLTTRYALKHGANYGQQISDIHQTFDALVRTQDELRQQDAHAIEAEKQRHIEDKQRAEAREWKPTARIITVIEGRQLVNKLSLSSSGKFAVVECSLLSPSGAKLADYTVQGFTNFFVGVNIVLTQNSLALIANTSPSFFQNETFQGSVRYTVVREDDEMQYTGVVPFDAESEYVGNSRFLKLKG